MYKDIFYEKDDVVVLDKIQCRDYTEQENPFTALKLQLGERILINNNEIKDKIPIIRWMAENQYKILFAV